MNWLAIIVVTTNVGHISWMEKIPAASKVACEVAVSIYQQRYDAAPAGYFYECVDIGSIVNGAKP